MTVLRTVLSRIFVLSATLSLTGLAVEASAAAAFQSASCVSDWVSTSAGGYGIFASDSSQGPTVSALAIFDDGTGPQLYAAGEFDVAGGEFATNIARWDGANWSALPGPGIEGGNAVEVHALQVYDDGTGAALYVGGRFSSAGGVIARGVAKWDGTQWSTLGFHILSEVYALSVFDRGSGPELIIGGFFLQADMGVPSPSPPYSANNIVSWDGSRLLRFGGGVNQRVLALEVFDDGGGEALYAGGVFSIAGAANVQNIARWDSQGWSDPGGGVNGTVTALEVFDIGTGPQLYVGGGFNLAGGMTAIATARYDGSAWSSFAGLSFAPSVLRAFDDGSGVGRALFAGGTLGAGNNLRRWSGGIWESPGSGFNDPVEALQPYDDGAGPDLAIGGEASDLFCVKKWDGSNYSPLGGAGLDGNVTALAVHDDGSGNGTRAYVSGNFTSASVVATDYLATWDGSNFGPVGGGIDSRAHAMVEFDDGSGGGPALYIGGDFLNAGGQSASRIARWDGANWAPLGSGVNGRVTAMTVWDDGQGGGPALYVGGDFTMAGGIPAGRIARYDGAQWSSVGAGPGFQSNLSLFVDALQVFDDGSGSALFVGGYFQSVDGIPSENAARWNGTAWSSAGNWSGVAGRIYSLASYDFGSGPRLYAGVFQLNSALDTFGIVTWDGTQWNDEVLTSSNAGADPPRRGYGSSMTVIEEIDGPALYVASSTFVHQARAQVIRFDGTTWNALPGDFFGRFEDSVAFDSGEGPSLLVGGRLFASPAGDTHLAVWEICALLEDFCFGDGGNAGCTPCPCGNDAPSGARGGCFNSVSTSARLIGSGSTDVGVGTLRFQVDEATPGSVALLISAGAALPAIGACPVGSGITSPVFDGLRCAGQGILRHGVRAVDAQGSIGNSNAGFGPPDAPVAGFALTSGFVSGQTRFFQAIYRDNPASQCGTGLNTTNGVRVLFR